MLDKTKISHAFHWKFILALDPCKKFEMLNVMNAARAHGWRDWFLAPILFLAISTHLAHANVVGADTQNFNPTNDGLDFVTVHSSKTLTPGLFNIGLFVNYAVNSLPNYENSITQTHTNFKDSLLSSDLNFAVGILNNWEVGLSMPALLSQDVKSDDTVFRGQFANTGITEFRGMTKFRFWGNRDHGVAAVLSANLNQVQDNPFAGANAGPTYNFELVADTLLDDGLALGVNVGYRLRNPGTALANVPIQPFGDQYITSVALSYLVPSWDTKIIGEVFGSWPKESQQFVSDRNDSTAEALLGIKTDISPTLAFHFGAGTEVMHGTSSPDWRVYTGLNWVIGPLFSKPREVFVRVDDQELKNLDEVEAADPFANAPQVTESFIARDILFEFNSDKLKPAAIQSLKPMVAYLNKPPGFKSLVIEGHTDSIGKPIYNLDLSQRRANRVRQAMIEMGVPGSKIRAIGYGASRPIANNGNYQGRAMNRRVEFKIQR